MTPSNSNEIVIALFEIIMMDLKHMEQIKKQAGNIADKMSKSKDIDVVREELQIIADNLSSMSKKSHQIFISIVTALEEDR